MAWFRKCLVVAVVATLLLAAVQFVPAGRVWTVRTWVRAERLWSRDLPLSSARGMVRAVEPALSGLGLLRPVRVEVEPGVNLLLDPADDVSRTILVSRQGRWEPEVWASIVGGLGPGTVFIDVGAHIGYDTLKAAHVVGPQGRVVAVEPNPRTLELLRANIEASQASNVTVAPFACTDVPQTLRFFDATAGGNSGSSSLSEANAGPVASSFDVQGRPLDDIVDELGLTAVHVIKADVEGAELGVIKGATRTITRHHPRLILEVVPEQLANMGTSVAELEGVLASMGYTQSRWIDYKNKEYLFAR